MSGRPAIPPAVSPAGATWGPRARFGLTFAGFLVLMLLGFQEAKPLVTRTFLYPMSAAATAALNAVGVPTRLHVDTLDLGYSLLGLETVTLRVVHECTGIFTLLILWAAICAYPARGSHRALGMIAAAATFFVLGTLRLVLLGVAAYALPAAMDVLHLWLMSLVNLGVAAFLWLSWIDRAVRR